MELLEKISNEQSSKKLKKTYSDSKNIRFETEPENNFFEIVQLEKSEQKTKQELNKLNEKLSNLSASHKNKNSLLNFDSPHSRNHKKLLSVQNIFLFLGLIIQMHIKNAY